MGMDIESACSMRILGTFKNVAYALAGLVRLLFGELFFYRVGCTFYDAIAGWGCSCRGVLSSCGMATSRDA